MIEMTLELAQAIGKAALQEADKINRPMGVSVVDESGRLVYFCRSDHAGFFTFDTSRAKAAAAASFKRSTKDITANKDMNPLLWYSLPSISAGQALPSPGGVAVMKDGHVIGAVGLGGGTPEEDHTCATIAAAVADQ